MPSPRAAATEAEMLRACLRALAETHYSLNHALFQRRLGEVGFGVVTASSFLARWVSGTRTIEVARGLLLDHPWSTVTEVIKHEMAHQYVDEVLRVHDETAHGEVFRKVCAARAIDPAATGLPAPGTPVDAETARALDRVAKLLALAQSQNQHEAEAAMAAARRIMLKHNLAQVGARAARGYVVRTLGEPSGRVPASHKVLGGLLGEHFFVQVIWVPAWRVRAMRSGTVLEVCGTPENVALAEYAHGFLLSTAEHLWREYRRARGIRSNRDRLSFETGVVSGFANKLRDEARRAQVEGLVWAGDAALDAFFHARHPRIVRGAGSTARRTAAYGDGRAAGARVVLHRGVGSGPSGGVKLLRG